MSYIIEKKSPLILTKLTNLGRKKIATGEIDWSYWSIGDSEIDYNYVEILNGENPAKILSPLDKNPPPKTFIEGEGCSILNQLDLSNKEVQECCVRNLATTRGFFSGDTATDMTILTGDTYIKTIGTVDVTQFNGTSSIDVGTVDFNDGDYILFKINNSIVGNLDVIETTAPVVYLWYKIEKTPLSTIITIDRPLPYFSFLDSSIVNFYIFPGGDSINEYYGSGSTLPYWNSETLEFISDCDISQSDVPILNQNNVWNENLLGTQSTNIGHEGYGSIEYVGQKEYLGYNKDCLELIEIVDCEDKLLSVYDDYVKGIGIIHFSNLNISNQYGEHFYIDNDNGFPLKINLPTIMYHRRYFMGSETGNMLGMDFITSGSTKIVENSQIEYFDLVEDPTLINPTGTPISIGRVYPQLKIVTIHDEEILATMSYKSNRNYTLPRLNGSLVTPIAGVTNGLIPRGKTLYVTYALESDHGLRYTLPQQKYTKFVNNTKISRDIQFSMEDVGLLPYMRQIEKSGYDGYGFYAHRFVLLAQLVDNQEDRPNPSNWRSVNMTTNKITTSNSYTIDPIKLENQNVANTDFILTKSKYNTSSLYNLNGLNLPELNCDNELIFGDEVFFFGNLYTNIGACIYRSIFKLDIDVTQYVSSSNPTWSNGQTFYFSEIGLYDSQKELIAITKFSRPIEMQPGTKFKAEISLDF